MKTEFAKGADRAELLDFLHAVFCRENPNHIRFEKLFPDLFEGTDEAMEHHAVIRDGGKIVACVGAYPMTLQIDGCLIPFAGIGQVSTAVSHLGRGCMRALISAQLDRLRRMAIPLVWLGGRHDRYAHFGFETASLSWRFWMDSHSSHQSKRTHSVRRIRHCDAAHSLGEDLWAMRSNAITVVGETLERYRKRFSRSDAELWVATPEGSDRPDAWAMVSLSHGNMMDSCGSAEGRYSIAAAATGLTKDRAFTVSTSSYDAEFANLLRKGCGWCGPCSESLLSLDNAALIQAYAPLLEGRKDIPDAALPSPDFVRKFFGPEPGPQMPFFLPGVFHV